MTVDVWVADVPSERRARSLLPALSADERARADRFRHDASQDAYITAHVLLRHALSARTGIGAEAWRFEAEPSGRPRIIEPDSGTRCRFSLTHCTGLAACIIADGIDVGIDAEASGRQVNVDALLRYYSVAERADIERAAPADRAQEFLRRWTLKESFVKALGVGIQESIFTDAGFAFDHTGAPQPRFGPATPTDPALWYFRGWTRGPFILAAAVHTPGGAVAFADHDVDVLRLPATLT